MTTLSNIGMLLMAAGIILFLLEVVKFLIVALCIIGVVCFIWGFYVKKSKD